MPLIYRFKLKNSDTNKLLHAIEQALKLGDGQLVIKNGDK